MNKKASASLAIGIWIMIGLLFLAAIITELVVGGANANLQTTYTVNGTQVITVCDTNRTLMGIGMDVCTNQTIHPYGLYVNETSNFTQLIYMENSRVCTEDNGYCDSEGSTVACTALGDDYVLANISGTGTCIKIIREDEITTCTGDEVSVYDGSTFGCVNATSEETDPLWVANSSLVLYSGGDEALNSLEISGGYGSNGISLTNGDYWGDGNIYIAGNLTAVEITQQVANSSLTPSTNNTFDLGSESKQWKNTYTNNITIAGKMIAPKLPHTYWYYNETYWNCINSSGYTLWNRGNTTLTCV